MGLPEKSKENLAIVDICLKSGHYNAGVNRAYYAAFQKIKDFLLEVGFTKDFVCNDDGKGITFAHGTISAVLINYLQDTVGVSLQKLANLYCYDDLYYKRRVADYYPNMMNEIDLKDRRKQVLGICKLIDSVREGTL